MSYSSSRLEIAADQLPEDQLGWANIVNRLSSAITDYDSDIPLRIALTASWGTGKTVFMKMLQQALEKEGYIPVYISAWKFEHNEDPLYPLIASVVSRLTDGLRKNSKYRKVASDFVTNVLLQVVRKQTGIDIAKATGAANAAGDDNSKFEFIYSIDHAQEWWSNELTSFLDMSKRYADQPVKKLILLVDEIDRCRPDWAVMLLERLKHMFSLEATTIVTAFDSDQLEASIKGAFGESFDSHAYLYRFFEH